MIGLELCFIGVIILLGGILFTLREVSYQLTRLADMFNKKYKYFD